MRTFKVLTTTDIESHPTHVEDLNRISAFVSPDKIAPTHSRNEWRIILAENAIRIAVCIEDDRIVGMGTLIVVRIPSRIKAFIEDVAVDEAYRKRGIATSIENELKLMATNLGAPAAYLTSGRSEAQKLWEKLGYEIGGTKPYFKKL